MMINSVTEVARDRRRDYNVGDAGGVMVGVE